MGWRVRSNHLGAIARRLPRELEEGVLDAAQEMTDQLKATIWRDTGKLRRVTTERNTQALHAEVWVGYYLGHGFYSGFQEFGTRRQPARPMVAPTAHRFEPQYALEMAERVKEACNAT